MSRIAAAITARDAAALLPDLFRSLEGHVDQLVVGVDDRTIDNTREVALAAGAVVFDVSLVRDGVTDFAQGRTQTFAHVPEDIDWILWIDSDDVLAGGPDGTTPPLINLHQLVDEVAPGTEAIWIPYLYTRDQYGNILVEHYRERVIRRNANPVWKARLHETVHTAGGPLRVMAEANLDRTKARILVDHRNQPKTNAGKWDRNYPILMKMLEEDPNDLRAVNEVAQAHFVAGNWNEAIAWLSRFIDATTPELSPGTPLEERWQAILYLSRAQRMAGRVRDALRTADRALLMCPQYADAYFELAYGYLLEGHWTKAIFWFEEGVGRQRLGGVLHSSPLDYDLRPFQTIHPAYFKVGNYEKAIDCVRRSLDLAPDDPDLHHALRMYTHWFNRATVVDSALQQAQYLIDTNEPLKAERLLTALPAGANEDFPHIAQVREKVATRLAHMRNPNAYRDFYLAAENDVDPVPDLLAGKTYSRMIWLLDRLKANGCTRVLNVGIGSGFDSLFFAKNGITTVGIDVDPKRVKDCNFAAVRAGFLGLKDAPEHTPVPPLHEGHAIWTAGCNDCGPVLQVPDITPDSPVQFWVADAERIPEWVRNLGPYDAVVLAELLEHVRSVDAVIEQAESVAPLVIITTPDGTAPQEPYPSHVRSWSRQELEQLGYLRGRVTESHYLIEDPDQLALEYRPGESTSERPPVVIYCGPGLEPWTPSQVNVTGLGGSETAVVHLASELVSRGFRVMVYAEAEGVWDGAYYRHHSKFVPENPVFLFVSWRHPEVFDAEIAAEHTALWVHDIDCGDNLTPERAEKIGSVWSVSGWHAEHLSAKYPFAVDKVVTVGNGIDPRRFMAVEQRDQFRFLYVSSPDRGLERALVFWPLIKKEIPQATLDIYYGWENYDALGRDPKFKAWITELAKVDGVTWHGRIGQRDLAREMLKSSALFYPGPHPFEETSCISALEAQAAGCVPVTRDNGALRETNKRGILLPNADATVLNYISALKSATMMSEERRKPMREWALTQTWAAVANRIIDHLKAERERVA